MMAIALEAELVDCQDLVATMYELDGQPLPYYERKI